LIFFIITLFVLKKKVNKPSKLSTNITIKCFNSFRLRRQIENLEILNQPWPTCCPRRTLLRPPF
jgi:hypothetical protein